jgi:hypothetical protein
MHIVSRIGLVVEPIDAAEITLSEKAKALKR